jgi:hypothetical protein
MVGKKPKLWRRKPKKALEQEWLKPKNVDWLKVSDNLLDRGSDGFVYTGRIKFKGKKPVRVAIKKFIGKTGYWTVRKYRGIIKKLRAEGIPLPKMDFVKHEGEWVLVSQLFIKAKKTKLTSPPPQFKKFKEIEDYASLAAKSINAVGRFPHDFIVDLKGSPFPLDLGTFTWKKKDFARGKATPKRVVEWTVELILKYAKPLPLTEKKRVLKTFLETLKKPKFKKLAQTEIQKQGFDLKSD